MITVEAAKSQIGARVRFVHPAQVGRNDSCGELRGLDPEDNRRALVKFDYDPIDAHVSHPLRELLIFDEGKGAA